MKPYKKSFRSQILDQKSSKKRCQSGVHLRGQVLNLILSSYAGKIQEIGFSKNFVTQLTVLCPINVCPLRRTPLYMTNILYY